MTRDNADRVHGVMLVQTALGYRLPTILSVDEQEMGAMLDAGPLLNLVVNRENRHRRVVAMMDKILRGPNPGDIPIRAARRATSWRST